jgi:CelD/BcsL family acetyltransferase involved in cellulose biosynthesis
MRVWQAFRGSGDHKQGAPGPMVIRSEPPVALSARVYEDLDALPQRFEELFRRAGNESLFHTLPWYRNFVRTVLDAEERLRIYAVEDASGAPRGALLMRHGARRAVPLRADALAGLANYYSSLFGPVMDPGDTEIPGILAVMARAIAADPQRWDTVDLHPLALDDVFPQIETALRGAGYIVGRYFCFGNWYLQVDGRPFRDYINSRPSRLSATGQRKRRKLERSGRLRFELITGLQGLDRALADYEAVYRSSWKAAEPYPGFIGGLARACAEQGWLRLGIAYLDGQPAAAQLWTVVEGTASIFKLAYDERFEKESVGTVLSSLLMQHVLEVDKVRSVDYLTGDDPYKRDWMSHRRERWGIIAFNPRTPRGLLAAARHQAGKAARRIAGLIAPGRSRPGET